MSSVWRLGVNVAVMVVVSPVIDTVLAVPLTPVALLHVLAEKATEEPMVMVVSAT